MSWTRIEGENDVAETLNRAIHAEYLARPQTFHSLAASKKLLMTADYSGDHRESPYFTIGATIIDEAGLPGWKARLEQVRRGPLGLRRMSYKGLGDGVKWGALADYLGTTLPLTGYCLSVAIEKELGPVVEDVVGYQGDLAPLSKWPPRVRMKALHVAAVLSVFIAGLCPAESDLKFFTDDDSIVATKSRLAEFVTLLRLVSGQMSQRQFGTIGYATPSNLFMEDLCAFPDLAAGALMGLLRSSQPIKPEDRSFTTPTSKLDEKTRGLMMWMTAEGAGLTRIMAIVRRAAAPEHARVEVVRRLA